MADRARVRVELVVAAARQRLVAEEVDRRELRRGEEVEAEGLVPAAPAQVKVRVRVRVRVSVRVRVRVTVRVRVRVGVWIRVGVGVRVRG